MPYILFYIIFVNISISTCPLTAVFYSALRALPLWDWNAAISKPLELWFAVKWQPGSIDGAESAWLSSFPPSTSLLVSFQHNTATAALIFETIHMRILVSPLTRLFVIIRAGLRCWIRYCNVKTQTFLSHPQTEYGVSILEDGLSATAGDETFLTCNRTGVSIVAESIPSVCP
jgi:hypothetical protein